MNSSSRGNRNYALSRALRGDNYNRVEAQDVLPAAPGYLPEDVRDEFVKICMDLQNLKPGLAKSCDRLALIAFARTTALYNECCRQLEQRAMHTKSMHGEMKLSPYSMMFTKLNAQMMRFYDMFGLSPLSRSRILAPPARNDEPQDEDEDEIDAMFTA